jgi:hypothetical protein
MVNIGKVARGVLLGSVATGSLVSAQVIAENPGGWEYSVAPLYLWGKAINGAASIGPLEAPLSLDFQDDILENLEAAFAIHFEAKQGDLTLFAEYNYAKLEPTVQETLGPVTVGGDIEFRDTFAELGFAYAFWNSNSTSWEVLGGIRYMEQEIDVELNLPDALPIDLPDKISGGDDWGHGFGGFRVRTQLSQNWSLSARADYGYRDGDNTALHGMGFVDYRFRLWGSFFAGYRYLDTDYNNGRDGANGYSFDGDQQGPIVGLSFYF